MQKSVSKAGQIITGIDINDVWNMIQYVESLYGFTKQNDDERLTKFIRSVKMPFFERVSVYYGGELLEHYFDIIKRGLVVIKEDMEPYQGGVHGKEKLEVKIKMIASVIKQQMEKCTFDHEQYALFIIQIMSKLCAPARDSSIENLKTLKDPVEIFK